MAYTTINKHTDHFNTKLYTGTGSSNAITGVGFQPDLVWLKSRSAAWDHEWYDAVRGAGYSISSVNSNAQGSSPQGVTAFDSDGFTVGTRSGANENNSTYASWNWKANGQGSSNTDGSTNTTYTSVNSTAGFSISTYAGTGSAATIGHGLGAAPEVVLIKCTTHTENWVMYHKSLNSSGAGTYIYLNTTAASGGSGSNTSIFNNTAPTSSVFTVNTDGVSNGSGKSYVAYCFKEKPGYSKFGSYKGNGSTDGTFVYTGFKPAFVIYKGAIGANAADNWEMADNKRSPHNGVENVLYPNLGNAEGTGVTTRMDLLSNGFKMRTGATDYNGSGQTYIYMAFGQSLVGSNNVPCTAR